MKYVQEPDEDHGGTDMLVSGQDRVVHVAAKHTCSVDQAIHVHTEIGNRQQVIVGMRQDGGPSVELMEQPADYTIGKHIAEAKGIPGDGHAGFAAEMWQDGGLSETRVVIPGVMHGDFNHRQAGFQMLPAMEQNPGSEYFDTKISTWQGSGLTHIQQSHHMTTGSGPMIIGSAG